MVVCCSLSVAVGVVVCGRCLSLMAFFVCCVLRVCVVALCVVVCRWLWFGVAVRCRSLCVVCCRGMLFLVCLRFVVVVVCCG